MKKLPIIIAAAVFVSTLTAYLASPVTAHTDSIWSLYLAQSLVKTGSLNLDEYSAMVPPNDYRTERIHGHIYSAYPIGTPLMAAPFVAIFDRLPVFGGSTFSKFLVVTPPGPGESQVEKLVASIIVALNAVLVFALALQYLNLAKSVILTGLFAFATPAWSTASRGLWQHGPSMLWLSLALYLVVLARRKPALSVLAAVPLAFAYVVRPTNSLSIAFFALYLLIAERRYFLYFMIGLGLLLAPFFIYNHSVYGQFLPPYYLPGQLNRLSPEALLGTLVSPSRGLLIYSPIFLLSFYGIYLRLKQAGRGFFKEMDIYLVGIIGLHWLVISAFPAWYGGWSIGPRYFSDMVPFLIFFLIPFFERLPALSLKSMVPKLGIPVLAGLAVISLGIHFWCSTNPGPAQWNGQPADVDTHLYRLWDWGDMQFLRNLCPGPAYQAPKCWVSVAAMSLESHQFKTSTPKGVSIAAAGQNLNQ